MPKLKIKKSLTRRFKITKSGKILRRTGFGRHLRSHKRKSTARAHKRSVTVTGNLEKKLKQVLGI